MLVCWSVVQALPCFLPASVFLYEKATHRLRDVHTLLRTDHEMA